MHFRQVFYHGTITQPWRWLLLLLFCVYVCSHVLAHPYLEARGHHVFSGSCSTLFTELNDWASLGSLLTPSILVSTSQMMPHLLSFYVISGNPNSSCHAYVTRHVYSWDHFSNPRLVFNWKLLWIPFLVWCLSNVRKEPGSLSMLE